MKGFVSIVGAGPGDPDLITVRGLRCLHQAEVVIYDNLIDLNLLDEIPTTAEIIYVGKKAGMHILNQEKINALLIKKAKEGKRVVRLKGGDPFVFGRGGEEALSLRNAGIPLEIIPGVTAGIAVPAYAGIPVTYRGVSSSFACVTGHEDFSKVKSSINWDHLAQGVDTLVFYMGFKNLPLIVSTLIQAGKLPDTPAAVIQSGTQQNQKTVTGTLKDIASKVEQEQLEPPVIIVIGNVVKLRESLQWFENKSIPLYTIEQFQQT